MFDLVPVVQPSACEWLIFIIIIIILDPFIDLVDAKVSLSHAVSSCRLFTEASFSLIGLQGFL